MKTKFYSLLTMGLLMAGTAYGGDPGSGTSVELKDWVPDAAKPSAVLQADGTIEISVIAPKKGSYNVDGVMGADEDLPSDCLMTIAVCKSTDASAKEGIPLQMFQHVAPGETKSCIQSAVTTGTTYYYTTMIMNEAAAAALPDGTDPEYIISDPFELTVYDIIPEKATISAEFNAHGGQGLVFINMPGNYEKWGYKDGQYQMIESNPVGSVKDWTKVELFRCEGDTETLIKTWEKGGEGWPTDPYLAAGKVFPGGYWCTEDKIEDYDASKTYSYVVKMYLENGTKPSSAEAELSMVLEKAISSIMYKPEFTAENLSWDVDKENVTVKFSLPTVFSRGSQYAKPVVEFDLTDQPIYEMNLRRVRYNADGSYWIDPATEKQERILLKTWREGEMKCGGTQEFVDILTEVDAYYAYYFETKLSSIATTYGYTATPYPKIYTNPVKAVTEISFAPALTKKNTVNITWEAPIEKDLSVTVTGYNVYVNDAKVNEEALTDCAYAYTYEENVENFTVAIETLFSNEAVLKSEAKKCTIAELVYPVATEVKAELSAEKDAVVVTWTAPAVAAENVKGYNVLVNDTKANEELLTECTFSYTIPEGAKKLSFVVQTVYVDDETANAEAVEFEVPEEPAPIEHLAATNVAAALSEDAKAILVTWTAPAVAAENLKGYNVLVDGTKANEALLTECSFRYPVPEKDADLSFVVQAVYTDDQTADSEAAVFKYSGIMLLTGDAEGLEIYTLQGVRVKNPGNGIFIIRQNGEVKKVGIRR